MDVGAKAEIYQILREMTKKGTSIILVSSDLPEVMSISDRIYVMHEGEITGELSGAEATEKRLCVLLPEFGMNKQEEKRNGTDNQKE